MVVFEKSCYSFSLTVEILNYKWKINSRTMLLTELIRRNSYTVYMAMILPNHNLVFFQFKIDLSLQYFIINLKTYIFPHGKKNWNGKTGVRVVFVFTCTCTSKNLRRYECFYGSNTLKQRQVLERQNNSTPLKYRNFHANNLRLHTS